MKNFMKEFKEFALKGNVMDMAVGVIIGGAFSAIITALIENIINPIIGLAFQTDFSEVVIHMGSVDLGIGAFISAVINFILMALVLFILVKSVNKIKAMNEKPAEPAPAPAKSDELVALEKIVELLEKK
ncbi:MAG: large conductance mechanosensitive channel protein MscL [Solobacterium sp.]|nr:large conductance mechanosensitive channel protein MscL [Solobacterium sp.]MBQ9823360.1 large conductance mechanosensitive channel protein MscL [Solobacterium sp.]